MSVRIYTTARGGLKSFDLRKTASADSLFRKNADLSFLNPFTWGGIGPKYYTDEEAEALLNKSKQYHKKQLNDQLLAASATTYTNDKLKNKELLQRKFETAESPEEFLRFFDKVKDNLPPGTRLEVEPGYYMPIDEVVRVNLQASPGYQAAIQAGLSLDAAPVEQQNVPFEQQNAPVEQQNAPVEQQNVSFEQQNAPVEQQNVSFEQPKQSPYASRFKSHRDPSDYLSKGYETYGEEKAAPSGNADMTRDQVTARYREYQRQSKQGPYASRPQQSKQGPYASRPEQSKYGPYASGYKSDRYPRVDLSKGYDYANSGKEKAAPSGNADMTREQVIARYKEYQRQSRQQMMAARKKYYDSVQSYRNMGGYPSISDMGGARRRVNWQTLRREQMESNLPRRGGSAQNAPQPKPAPAAQPTPPAKPPATPPANSPTPAPKPAPRPAPTPAPRLPGNMV